jgi:hypothetical protein
MLVVVVVVHIIESHGGKRFRNSMHSSSAYIVVVA